MIFSNPLKSSRLILKKESINDFERFFLMSKDPQVMRYIGDGSIFHWTQDVALKKFTHALSCKKDHEVGRLSVYRKDIEKYIGWCGVKYSKFLNHMELDYRYLKDSWGQGYATEAGHLYLKEFYKYTDTYDIQSCVHPENKSSIRVLEKLGFALFSSKYSRPISKDIFVYKINREMFKNANRIL